MSPSDKVRARLTRREAAFSDDFVEITLDTFSDRRRGYLFWANPLGVQAEALWTEDRGDPDFSFDTLWHCRGQRTEQGYVVWMAIPFKSLRFTSKPDQTWGITLLRVVPRFNEWSYWPHVSSRVEGRLSQAGTATGLTDVSPGRNLQFIPYGVFRSFRALDARDPERPRFVTDRAELDGGLDAKVVFKDSLVVDLALNPDFSQVESDEPQITANQRFEVLFPEKRPFFLENLDYFKTPINLIFTRRIADPQLGVRLTGKVGPYSIGTLLIDDESPGKSVPADDFLSGRRARFGIVRISRDVLRQSTLGLIYADRQLAGSFNRVAGIDGRLRIDDHWVARFQAVGSSTQTLGSERRSGSAYEADLSRTGRTFNYNLRYSDRSPAFHAAAGFIPRTDIRHVQQLARYSFRPEKRNLVAWGPGFLTNHVWDHRGTRLNLEYAPFLNAELGSQTFITLGYSAERELLRPADFPVLASNRDFARNTRFIFFATNYLRQVSVQGEYRWGQRLNFVPPAGQEPHLAGRNEGFFGVTLRPLTPLLIDNRYVLLRLTERSSRASISNNHIIRSKWNWQFNRELSVRAIFQYDTLLANPALTGLKTARSFNTDFLFTYQVNPWTALYIGYNSNLRDIELVATSTGSQILSGRDRFLNDGRQFFVKFSYLFRF